MRSEYSEAGWDQIVNGHRPWNIKGPFLGKKKGFRLLRVATAVYGNLVSVETKMAFGSRG